MTDPWLPADHGSESGALQKRVARGLTWTFIDTWGSQILGLLTFALLARLLAPADFGLVTLAAVFVAFAQLFVDQGLGDALIQKPSVTRRQIDTAFWVAVVTGLLLTAIGVALSNPLATFLKQPDIAPIIAVLSLSFVVTSLSSVQMALLRREMAFRSLAIRRLAAVVAGGIVGIVAAFAWHNAWALVAQQIAYGVVSVVMLWTVSPWRPSLRASREDFRELFSFGINVVGSDILNFLSRNIDDLLIGVYLGMVPLGIYGVGYKILDTSQALLVNAARKLAFPVFARIQNDPERVKRAYGRVNRAVSVIILPGYIGLALVAQEAIVVLFGQKWAASGLVATTLFLIGPVLTVQVFSGALLNATGHPDVSFRFRLATTGLHVAGFILAIVFFHDIVAVAAAWVITGYVMLPVNLYLMRKYIGISIVEHLMQLRGVALATALMAGAVLAVKFVLVDRIHPAVLLLIEVITGAGVFGVALFLFERELFKELATFALQALPGGGRIARLLHIPIEGAGKPRRRLTKADLEAEAADAAEVDRDIPTRGPVGIDPSLGPETDA